MEPLSTSRPIGTVCAIEARKKNIDYPSQSQIHLTFFYIHEESLLFDDVFPDFEFQYPVTLHFNQQSL